MDGYVNDSVWLTHGMVDSAIRRESSVSETFDMRDECYRVGASFLGDLLGRVLDDRAEAERETAD